MKKETLAAFIIALMFSIFSVSYTFAAGNFQNGVRNVVGGAENVVEDVGSGIGRTVQSGVNTLGNGARDMSSMATNNGGYTSNNGYTTTRTATTTASDDLASSTTMYTWVIIGVTAVGIGVLLWSYFTQNNKNNMYIDSDE